MHLTQYVGGSGKLREVELLPLPVKAVSVNVMSQEEVS